MLCVDIYVGENRFRLFNKYRAPSYNVQSTNYMNKNDRLSMYFYKYQRSVLHRR